ncbi:hypothetical protein ES702_07843 [subsurface metagenome]
MRKKRYYACHLFAYPEVKFELSLFEGSPPHIKVYCQGFFSIFLSHDQAKDLEEQLQLALRITDYDYTKKGRSSQ